MGAHDELAGRLSAERRDPSLDRLRALGAAISSAALTDGEYRELARGFAEVVSASALGDPVGQTRLLVEHVLAALRRDGDAPVPDRVALLRCLPVPAATPPPLAALWASAREEAAGAWLRTWEDAHRLVDPAFDPADQPALSVAPPAGRVRRPGTEPAEITDPDERRAYEQALEANTERIRRSTAQVEARQSLDELERQLPVFLTEAYGLGPDARSELRRLLTEDGVPESMAASILEGVRRRRHDA